ncbi:MAG: hypothetical protein HQL85_13600 [Magnetococcales bacterium]|nr:hypothetical protein [Magnetococcales bacterium]
MNPNHQEWRRAELWFAPIDDPKISEEDRKKIRWWVSQDGVTPLPMKIKSRQADLHAVQRGTVQHEVYEGTKADIFRDGDHLELQVSCKEDAGVLEEDVPYAIAMTLEVDPKIGVQIYDEVRARVHAARIAV